MSKNLHNETSAKAWMEEWMKTIEKHPHIPTDEGSMIGWFANAIMAGHDCAIGKCPDCLAKMVKSYQEDEEGNWNVRWLCDCEVPDEIIAQAAEVAA